jgi:hypothetical protein
MKIKIKNNKGRISWATEGIHVHSLGDDYKTVDVDEDQLEKVTKHPDKFEVDEKGKIKSKKSKQ